MNWGHPSIETLRNGPKWDILLNFAPGGPPKANLDMEPLNIMGDWYQVERSRLWSLPLSKYQFLQKKTQMFQINGNLDIFVSNYYSRFFKNEYLFWMNNVKKMNNLFEYTYILILVCLRQKLSPKNVSNSSQIIQESFIGAFSVHFRGPWPIQGPMEGSETILWPFIGILNNFP